RQGEDQAAEVDPARPPAEGRRARVLRPLVDAAREGELPGQLGEAEGHRHLADEHQRPGPDEGGAAGAVAQIEHLEEPGQDGDVGEAGGEAREAAERPAQLLAVAVRREIDLIVVTRAHVRTPEVTRRTPPATTRAAPASCAPPAASRRTRTPRSTAK